MSNKCPQCDGPHTLSQCPNWRMPAGFRLLPVVPSPAIRDALVESGRCFEPDSTWAAIIAAYDLAEAREHALSAYVEMATTGTAMMVDGKHVPAAAWQAQAAPIQSGDEIPVSMSTYGTKEACEAEHARRAALASTPSAAMQGQGVPEGWKLVPTHPDQAMLAAFLAEYHRKGGSESGCYHAMLAAAPTPPAAQPQAGGRELTDADIERIMRDAIKDGELSWLGFRKDEHDRWTVPILSLSHYQIARAIEKHITGTKGATE